MRVFWLSHAVLSKSLETTRISLRGKLEISAVIYWNMQTCLETKIEFVYLLSRQLWKITRSKIKRNDEWVQSRCFFRQIQQSKTNNWNLRTLEDMAPPVKQFKESECVYWSVYLCVCSCHPGWQTQCSPPWHQPSIYGHWWSPGLIHWARWSYPLWWHFC